MTVSVFQDFLAQTAQAIGIETESSDPYQQVFELAERCEESDQLREKLDEYSKFFFKSLKIDCRAKNQWDDIAPEVLQYIFIAILRKTPTVYGGNV